MTLLDKVKSLAKEKGLSLGQIEELAGLGKNTLYGWRRSKPTADTLMKVAKILNVSVDYLLGNVEITSVEQVRLKDIHSKLNGLTPDELNEVNKFIDFLIFSRSH